ncbi:MAG: glycosyltransferase family 39 protein [Planctomycetes bacterium]|nr:glycosyltransferase family 39 protein [Planctomycetota bacterium]
MLELDAAMREPKSEIRNPKSAIAAILLLAALLRFFPLGLSNPRFHHQDEWDFVQSAVRMWAEGTLDPGPPYVHPGLYRYATAAAYPIAAQALGGLAGPAERAWLPYVAGRFVSAAMGVLAVWLVYRLGRQVMPGVGALAGALILAAAPLHVQFSHVAKPDVMSATFVALATLLAWQLAEAPQRKLYAWAGVAVGLAVASKYSGIVAAAPIVVAHLAAPGSGRRAMRLFAPDLWLAAACSLLAFAVASPYTLLKLGSLGEGYGLLIGRPPDFEHAPHAPALAAFARQALEWIGPAPLALAAAGAALWWRERRIALFVVGSVILSTLALLSLWAVQRPFYLLPLVPAVATLAAAPIAWLGAKRRWAGALLLTLCLVPSAALSVREVVRFALPTTRQLALAWLLKNVPHPQGSILRDDDSLELSAEEKLPIIDAGLAIYYKVDRDYLKKHGVVCFVLSDTAAATDYLTPEAAGRRVETRSRLLDCGEELARVPRSWWREGPEITIHKVKDSVLREFESERERAASELRAKVKEAEGRLAAAPGDAALHMEAGRLLSRLVLTSKPDEAIAAWDRSAEHFRQALRADPKLADALYNLGCLCLLRARSTAGARSSEAAAWFARAADAFRAAIALDPNQADYHFNLGYTLCSLSSAVARNDALRRHALEEGARAYRRAAELRPDIRPPDPHILAVAERGPQPFR